MKLIPCLLAAATTLFATSAFAVEDGAHITTVSGIRSVLTENLDLKYLIDSEGDIQIPYQDGETVRLSFINSEGEKLSAENGDGAIYSLRIYSVVKSGDMSDYNRFIVAANNLNASYYLKACVNVGDDECYFIIERYEYLSSSYSAEQFIKTFASFLALDAAVESGEIDIDLLDDPEQAAAPEPAPAAEPEVAAEPETPADSAPAAEAEPAQN